MNKLLIALTATIITAGGAAFATPAIAATPAPTASASASASPTATPTATATPAAGITLTNTVSGSASNLTGVLAGLAGGSPVVLQRAKGSSTNWVDLETAVSDAQGTVSFPGVHSDHSQLYRVVSGTVTSNVVAVKQYAPSPASISLQVTRTGDYLTTTGTASYTSVWLDNGAKFTDTITGLRVHLQRYTTKWKDADIIRSGASGAVTDKVKYSSTNLFRYAAVATSTYQVSSSVAVVK